MSRSDWSCLLSGLVLIAFVACRPPTEEEVWEPTAEPITTEAVTMVVTPEPTAGRLTATRAPTSIPPDTPTAVALVGDDPAETWQEVGDEFSGLQFSVPPNWVNLTRGLDTGAATTPWGLVALLAADSDRTGSSLLAGKEIRSGAYVLGLIANFALSTNDPVAGIEQLLQSTDLVANVTGRVTSTTGQSATGPVRGAYIDIQGDPIDFLPDSTSLRTRILLFTTPDSSSDRDSQVLVLLTAHENVWAQYSDTFQQIGETIFIYDPQSGFSLSEGAANVLGDLNETSLVRSNLDPGATDVWTFTISSRQYATLILEPDDSELDLQMVVFGPSGQTVAAVDNSYAGDTEFVPDLLLAETGTYVVEVREFFGEAGRYSLSLALTGELLFDGGGPIRFGQGIQSELPDDGQHVWTFKGTADQLISMVVTPNDDKLDVILELNAPDGRRLFALDEGFSGDPEVVSGYLLDVTGDYAIIVRGFAGHGGPYSLTLEEGGEDTANFYDAGDIDYGEVVGEALRASEAHAWFFNGRAGDQISVRANPMKDDLDLEIWLLSSDVVRLAWEDTYADGEPELISYQLEDDGQYFVLVRDFHGVAGSYELALTAVTAGEPELVGTVSFDVPVDGTLAANQAVIWYFNASRDDQIDVHLAPQDDADLVFSLRDPDGNVVVEVDNMIGGRAEMLLAHRITEDGQWGIVVREFFGEATAYELTIAR